MKSLTLDVPSLGSPALLPLLASLSSSSTSVSLVAALRQARKALREGGIDAAAYEERVNEYMRYAVDIQEKIGLDVLVHGEPERSDMCAPRTSNPDPDLQALSICLISF